MCEDGRAPTVPTGDPAQNAAAARRRSMLEMSYAGSALVGQAGSTIDGGRPGALSRRPPPERDGAPCDRVRDAPGLDDLRVRWDHLVSID